MGGENHGILLTFFDLDFWLSLWVPSDKGYILVTVIIIISSTTVIGMNNNAVISILAEIALLRPSNGL